MARYTIEIQFDIDDDNVSSKSAIIMRNLFRGTKKATIQACEEILQESLQQVPRRSGTLAASAYYDVRRRSDTAATTWAYEGEIGYGGNGDPISPMTGRRASEYMVAVHENLDAYHENGKAKFLEDPVREYMSKNFSRVVETNARNSVSRYI